MSEINGYAGKILRVNLSTGKISETETGNYSELFLGGRGIAAKIHWDEVPPECHAFDPENRLVFMTGPLCGIPGLAASRWQATGKSPVHNRFSYCNLGSAWGAQVKFAGYDGLVVHGKSEKLVYLLIDNGRVEIKDASSLKGKGAIYTREKLKEDLGKDFCVVSVGAAGENGVHFSILLSDQDATGSNGLGSVMGLKNLKAIAARGNGKVGIADKDRVQELRKRIREMKTPGKDHIWPTMLPNERLKRDLCYGCIDGCMRQTYTAEDGQSGKYICQAAVFYEIRAQRFYGEITDVPFKVCKMCDDYGVDSRAIETMIMWLNRCSKSGILTEGNTGLPLSKVGSLEFIETLLNKISFREGFGDVLADGTLKAAEKVGEDSEKLITDYMVSSGENSVYGPRLYITTGLLYAMEPRMPIQQLHEISVQALRWAAREQGLQDNYMTSDVIRAVGKRFWESEIAADFSTYEGKAMSAVRIQDRQYAKECLIVCDFAWPIITSPITEDHVGDPAIESRVLNAVTGAEIDEQGLYRIGERVFNLQRAILAREGHKGREYDSLEEFNYNIGLKGDYGNPECLVPGKDGEPFSRAGMVVERDKFEKMKDEYYKLRRWDVSTGLQTGKQMEDLDLGDVADDLKKQGLLA